MDREIARRAIQIFEEAIALNVSARPAFLENACRDSTGLRAEVDALLATFEDDEGSSSLQSETENQSSDYLTRFEPGMLLDERYLIESLIGTGGMGMVYRARDTRLDRPVAIKVLNQASRHKDELRERFEREIKSVARLTHPHIVTLYDTSVCDGADIAVMELIDGETLRTVIGDGLDWKVAAKIILSVAKALVAAHGQGVIHRDIKPDNVMIDARGEVKVLDFGLAKPTDHLNHQRITTGSATPGTVPYMSPEQTNGQPLQESTDIFSLGTMLFELLAGENPFRAESAFATMQNINGASPRIAQSVNDLPNELVSLTDAMLRRNPKQRPTSAEIANELESLLELPHDAKSVAIATLRPSAGFKTANNTKTVDSTSTQIGRPSIAVLPLQSLCADPVHSFLGDAIAQEVIVELARLHWLFVIARGSSFQFRDKDVNVSEVGSILGARYVLTGTVEMFGSQGAVSVELLQASDQKVVWAERFPVTMDDLLQLRHTITSNIVVSIEHRIQVSEAESAKRIGTENLDAWGAYHRGLWHMFRFTPNDNATATQLFQQAVAKDPLFARAFAGLSFTHFQAAFLRFSDDEKGHQNQARSFANKSLELDPLDPFTNLTMGRAAWLFGDLDGADSWFGRSLEISPNYAFAWYNRSLNNALRSHGDDAEQGASKAMLLSPIDPLSYAMYGTTALSHVVRGDYEQAIPWTLKALNEPTAHVHMWLIAALVHQLAGETDIAAQQAATVSQKFPGYSQSHFLDAFPFQDPDILERCKQALSQLGF